MKISQQQLKKIVKEEFEQSIKNEELTEEQLQEIFDGLKAGWQAGKQEFAYRRALKSIQGVLNKSVLPTFDKMLKTYTNLTKEKYDFPQVNAQFKKTLTTILTELESVVAALPDDEAQKLKATLSTKKNELQNAASQLKAMPKAPEQGAQAAEKPATQQTAAPAAKPTTPPAPAAAAKRDDQQQVDEVFGDIAKAFKQGNLARISANYVQTLRKMVDTVKPALLNLRKLSPVLKAQKQAVEDPVAIKKAQDAKATEAEPEALPAAGKGLDAPAPTAATTPATPTDTGSVTSSTPPPASGAKDTAAAPAAAETATSTGTPTSGDISATNTPPEATTSPVPVDDREPEVPAAAVPTAASSDNKASVAAPTSRPLNRGERRAAAAADRKKPPPPKIKRRPGKGRKREESIEPVSYNKLYENWRRFTKG